MPRVSAVIATFDRPEFLSRALESVRSQTYDDYEIIVVDDGSSTDVSGVVHQTVPDGRVIFVSQENKGRSAARNRGARIATGRYLAFLDDDDLWEPQKLDRQVAYLERHEDIGLVHAYTLVVGERGEILEPETKKRLAQHMHAASAGYSYSRMCHRCTAWMSSVMVRRRLFESIGGFDEAIEGLEDWDFYLRVALRAKIAVIERPLVRYRTHDENTPGEQFVRSRIQTARKHLALLAEAPLAGMERQRARAALHRQLSQAHYMSGEPRPCRHHAIEAVKNRLSLLWRSRLPLHYVASYCPARVLDLTRRVRLLLDAS